MAVYDLCTRYIYDDMQKIYADISKIYDEIRRYTIKNKGIQTFLFYLFFIFNLKVPLHSYAN